MPRIYLDTCCLNRPFDDQTQTRVRLEAEAVVLILDRIEQDDNWIWIGSDVLDFETSRISDGERRRRIEAMLQFVDDVQLSDSSTTVRAQELQAVGFHAIDALHVASAEQSNCEIVLTTDDRMLGAARRNVDQIQVRIENPIDWLREVEQP
jgi:hypothetical protein